VEVASIFQSLATMAGLFAYWGLYIATGFACAFYVYQDAIKHKRRALNIHPYWWAALAFIGNVWALFAYWVMQHSTLVKTPDE